MAHTVWLLCLVRQPPPRFDFWRVGGGIVQEADPGSGHGGTGRFRGRFDMLCLSAGGKGVQGMKGPPPQRDPPLRGHQWDK